MKRFVGWYQAVSIAFAIAAVASSLAITFTSKTAPAIAQTTNIRGWAWSGTTGWMSLNSANCTDLNSRHPGTCTPAQSLPNGYGLNLNLANQSGGSISGYAWSEYLGWVCFGKKPDGTSCGSPPRGVSDITFTCKDLDGATVSCDQLSWNKCSNANKMCNQASDCGEEATCNFTGNAPSANLTGWAHAVSLAGNEGWIDLHGTLPEDAGWNWAKLYFERGTCSNDTTLTCTMNSQCGAGECRPDSSLGAGLGGYAWHYAGGAATAYGMGWVSLNEQTSEVLFPYLYAEGGDVFSGRGVRTAFPPPKGERNADYLVHVRGESSGDLSARFRSRCTDPVACRTRSYELELPQDPTGDEPYTFRLGRFDFQGLMGPMSITDTGTNRYGHTVVKLNETGLLPGTQGTAKADEALGGRVFVLAPRNPSLTYQISQPLVLQNSNTTSTNGAGTIIVRGNLQVGANVTYEGESVGSERVRLASAVWIVLGDVIVEPGVSKLAGTFIILGRRKQLGVCTGSVRPFEGCTADAECGAGGTCLPSSWCVDRGAVPETCTATCSGSKQCIPADPKPSNPPYGICVTLGETSCGVQGTSCGVNQQCRSKCLLKDSDGSLRADCGRFVSGQGSSSGLTVAGSVFARQFKLERSYVDPVNKSAAEHFVADGRLQLNPPPGMADFAKGLPTFRRQ